MQKGSSDLRKKVVLTPARLKKGSSDSRKNQRPLKTVVLTYTYKF